MTESSQQDAARECFVASKITGVGMSVPDNVVPNEHFASYLETSDEWITERTGIKERRWADPSVSASELAHPASLDAIASAGLEISDIDGIICATVTPDNVFPSTACYLQKRLGASGGFAFDVNAVCSGFVYALASADSFIRTGLAKNILVVGVDLYSRIIDKNDRGTCVLFGDGAGAVVVSRAPNATLNGSTYSVAGSALKISGIYSSKICADGSQAEILYTPGGTATPITPESVEKGEHFLRMNGREVFKLAVRSLVEVSNEVLSRVGLEACDVDHFVSHQANQRILSSMAKHLKVSEDKVPMNVEKYGNTSAATIPILLAECVEQGRIKDGDLVLVSAVGGGLSWGAVLLRW